MNLATQVPFGSLHCMYTGASPRMSSGATLHRTVKGAHHICQSGARRNTKPMKAKQRLCAGKCGVLSPCINRYQYPSCETAPKGTGIDYGFTQQMRIAPKLEGSDLRNSLPFLLHRLRARNSIHASDSAYCTLLTKARSLPQAYALLL